MIIIIVIGRYRHEWVKVFFHFQYSKGLVVLVESSWVFMYLFISHKSMGILTCQDFYNLTRHFHDILVCMQVHTYISAWNELG